MTATEWERIHAAREWGLWPDISVVRFVRRKFPQRSKGRTALDIGCGAGAVSFFLASEGFDVHGIDASASAIERCRMRASDLPISFKVQDASRLPYEGHAFDLVVDVACLQHLADCDAVRALFEARRVLKKGGWFFSLALAEGSSEELHEGLYARHLTRAACVELYGGVFGTLTIERETRTDQGLCVANWIVMARKGGD